MTGYHFYNLRIARSDILYYECTQSLPVALSLMLSDPAISRGYSPHLFKKSCEVHLKKEPRQI